MRNRKFVVLACLCVFLLSACQSQSTGEAKVKFEDFKIYNSNISWNSTKQDIREAYTAGTMEEKGNDLIYSNSLGAEGELEASIKFSFSDENKLKSISEAWSFDDEKMSLLMYRGTIDGLKEMYGEPKISSYDVQSEMVFWNTQIEDTEVIMSYNYSKYTGKYFYLVSYHNNRIKD